MNFAKLKNLDLNLLLVAAALYRHKNVSRAAEELGLSQSAVSHALTRLRDQFKDPLFARTAKGMAPTKYAKEIENELVDILRRTELLASRQTEFSPASSEGRVCIATTDYFEILVMPKLQKLLAQEAPKLQISLRPTRGDLPKRDIEDGSISLGIAGFYRDLPEGFYQSKLFEDGFSSAVGPSSGNFKSKKLSLEAYQEARHALITLQGDFRENTKGAKDRFIGYGSYSFLGMAWVLQESDMILTAPSRLLAEFKKFFPLQTWPCPVDRGQIDVRMVWHTQTHTDPLYQWLRAKIKNICAELK